MVSDELLRTVEKYAAGPDKGKKFCQELAAKQLAVFKGLGFAAGYLGGIHKADGFGPIIELAESYGADDWKQFIREIQYSQPDEFFFFEHDLGTGLSDAGRINREYLDSLKHPPKSKQVNLNYRLSRLVHGMAFTRDKALYPLLTKIFARLDKKPGFLSRMAYRRGAGLEAGDVRLPGLRRLQPARLRLPLSQEELLEVRPQRAVRRIGRRPLRIGRQGMFLGPDLRAAEVLRRVGDDARPAGDDLQRHAEGNVFLGQYVPRPRSSRTRKKGLGIGD